MKVTNKIWYDNNNWIKNKHKIACNLFIGGCPLYGVGISVHSRVHPALHTGALSWGGSIITSHASLAGYFASTCASIAGCSNCIIAEDTCLFLYPFLLWPDWWQRL